MPRNNYFQFKQFRISQEKAAMKISTDGVLLGAWADLSGAEKILDIGTGTGIIALMAAQKSDAIITGIEIEENAAGEAALNAANSPWSKRIHIIHTSFQSFVRETEIRFDRIISNPPYFLNDKRSANINMAIARHSDKLPIEDLAKGAAELLAPGGRLILILPVFSACKFIKCAETQKLHLKLLTEVKHAEIKPVHRYLMEFSREKTAAVRNNLTIFDDKLNNFSEDYKTITRDFYLRF